MTQPADLAAVWVILETEAAATGPQRLKVNPTGATVSGGEVLAGVDVENHRHLLIPLQPGEAFAEDRTSMGVQLRRVEADGRAYVGVICLVPTLNEIFATLANEILATVLLEPPSPARAVAEVLAGYKALFAAAISLGYLGQDQMVGLLAELLSLKEIVSRDPLRRITGWTGPLGHQHDLRANEHAVEVKASTAREGRRAGISSIDQLCPAPSGTLHLAFYRFEASEGASGITLPGLVRELTELGVDSSELHRRLTMSGYSPAHDSSYRGRSVRLIERRLYDVTEAGFPRIIRSSFSGGQLPPGTLNISYTIDLSNEPPLPLDEVACDKIWCRLAQGV